MPHNLTAKILVMVAPSCGRVRRSLKRVIWAKFENDLPYFLERGQGIAWLHKLVWNMVYLITSLKRSLLMASSTIRGLDKLPSVKVSSTVVVSYEGDPWSGYIPKAEMTKHSDYRFIKRPGIHDDIWLNPDPYIALINDVLM